MSYLFLKSETDTEGVESAVPECLFQIWILPDISLAFPLLNPKHSSIKKEVIKKEKEKQTGLSISTDLGIFRVQCKLSFCGLLSVTTEIILGLPLVCENQQTEITLTVMYLHCKTTQTTTKITLLS